MAYLNLTRAVQSQRLVLSPSALLVTLLVLLLQLAGDVPSSVRRAAADENPAAKKWEELKIKVHKAIDRINEEDDRPHHWRMSLEQPWEAGVDKLNELGHKVFRGGKTVKRGVDNEEFDERRREALLEELTKRRKREIQSSEDNPIAFADRMVARVVHYIAKRGKKYLDEVEERIIRNERKAEEKRKYLEEHGATITEAMKFEIQHMVGRFKK